MGTTKSSPAVNGRPYALIQRLLHWLIALIVIVLLAAGTVIGTLGYDGLVAQFGSDVTNLMYTTHKTFGIMVLILMVLRLGLRLAIGAPGYDRALPGWQMIASRISHWGFYVLLIAMPLVGWLATAAGGYPVDFFNWTLPGLINKNPELSKTLFELHALIGLLLIVLILVHAGAALLHWLVWRDGVMARMALRTRRD
ncbi:MAG: cytochrome b [Sphingobacteriia bacterium]|nr:cytochrome b [Sphingobacteriia bacterium]NCC41038.1 cytochrome b [Gammaproteobacteria bacterium]